MSTQRSRKICIARRLMVALCLLLSVVSLTTSRAAAQPRSGQPPAKQPSAVQPQPRGSDGAPMVRVEAGPFLMGTAGTTKDGDPDERPRRSITLPAYWIDAHEVTNAQYKRFCDETDHKPPIHWKSGAFPAGQEQFPVVNVTWENAAAYAKWAGKRLPTEAEWEKAARGTDGRVFPWGNEFDAGRAALDDEEQLGAVGRFPTGASPYGCLDMAGNVWEWTADWYDAYPGAKRLPVQMVGPVTYSPRSIHYGKKYKVIRGGGAIAYYGIPNTGRSADRARALPFAGYDGLGFRCVMDGGTPRPFDTDISAAYVPTPPHVRPVKPVLKSPVVLTVTESAGAPRRSEIVTSGLPFPPGALRSPENVRLLDATGYEVPLQTRVTGTWRDGSIQWLLLDFPCSVGANQTRRYRLEWGAGVQRKKMGDEGRLLFTKHLMRSLLSNELQIEVDGKQLKMNRSVVPNPVGAVQDGPLRMSGWLRAEVEESAGYGDESGKPQFLLRSRSQSALGAMGQTWALTLTQVSDKPLLNLTGWRIPILSRSNVSECLFGGDTRHHRFAVKPGERWELLQESEMRYVITRNGKTVASGTRAPGRVTVFHDGKSYTIAIRDFWQQYPMALLVHGKGVTLRAWAGREPFDFDRGMAKTIEIFGASGSAVERGEDAAGEDAAKAFQQPLFAAAPPQWYCATGALGELQPYDLDRFADYETPVEADLDHWMRNRPHGLRHWGDAYMGGPYKGKNAYNNLEYDIPYDFFMQFARTGHRKYLDAAIAGARHQSDIDTNHVSGQPWKHSPRHTETPAELGHVFLRGLIEYTHFTGDPRGLETARRIGDWLCDAILDRGETGNERQIGWGLYALTGVYAATWDKKYLDACKTFVDRLIAGQQPTGKFAIRWDNRISFFNGLAMAGLRRYYEATGDERVPPAILRLINRTLGFYPEYAGRTLDGLTWAYDRSGDRRYLTLLARTWETTAEYNTQGSWGPASTLFATRYLPFLVRHGLAPEPPRPLSLSPAQLATDNGLYLTRLEVPRATLYLRDATGQPFDLVIFRQAGITPGTVSVAAFGKDKFKPHPLASVTFAATGQSTARHVLQIPGGAGPRVLKVTLGAENTKAWNVVTTRAMPRVLQAPSFEGAHRLVPRVYFRADGPRLEARFEAKSEGFHGAVLYDAAGCAVAAATKFIDLEDTNTYPYVLSAPIPAAQRGQIWSMDIQDARLLSLAGAAPLFATSRAAFFDPFARNASRSTRGARKTRQPASARLPAR